LLGDRTAIGHLVVDIKLKVSADGEPTIPRVRLTFAAPREGSTEGKFVFYSGCGDSTTNRVTVQLTLQRNAKQASNDVSGAYWKGKPSPAEQGSRRCFLFIPDWLSRQYPYLFPARDTAS
jgi:hypothetical protein